MKPNLKNKILRMLLASLLVIGGLGILNASGQTYIVAAAGIQLSAPIRVNPIEPEPATNLTTLPINPVVPSQPVVPPNPDSNSHEPEATSPPLF